MVNQILMYLGAFFTCAWGIAHLCAAKPVVQGFGETSQDNKHIITMEWIIEGVCLIFIGLLVATVTCVDISSKVAVAVYWICIAELVVLAVVSIFTGFKVNSVPFKLCPVIFGVSAILILLGILI